MPEIRDPLFREAVAAIDAGNVPSLERLLRDYPDLVRARVTFGDDAYFSDPYLLWFVAENPVRNGRLPENIAEVTRVLLRAGAEQAGYTLMLVASGRVPRESGVQRELMEVLLDAGADPNDALLPALAHRERDAVELLLERGARMTVVAAACTGRGEELARLIGDATPVERQMALSGAALYGDAEMLARIIAFRDAQPEAIDLDAYSPEGFHAAATALHHAVDSGSLDAVKTLVEAGVRRDLLDRIYQGTPLDWAEYLERAEIAAYLHRAS
ncbi:MAG TPA: ankyrin repeat domain-containing protein [Thermoanaerobaculia bacterium]|jgi:peptide-methionine (S)-S-oxide reductase